MSEPAVFQQPVALVDILDRVLGQGVVVAGEIVIGIAEIDLVRVSLRALLASIRADPPGPADARPTATAEVPAAAGDGSPP